MSIGQKTVYLVDDDITNLAMGNDALNGFYNVFTFNSADLFLKMFDSHIPDLILLDIKMPDMDGYELIKLIKRREETRHIPVIFLTAQIDAENELKGLTLGAVDYITKPFTAPLLLKRIELHLLIESQRKQLKYYSDNLLVMVDAKTKMVMELQNAILTTFAELVEYRDNITGEHIGRTQSYLDILFEALQKKDAFKKQVASWNRELFLQSAQLHDVGKIAIKDNILQKPGKLTAAEFEKIKSHVTFGISVIEKIRKKTSEHAFLEQARILIASHHEKWDGSGYPRGLKGEEIPLQGRLMAIADVYDALVSERPYKKALTHSEAEKTIVNSKGTHFDPALVDLFMEVSDKFNRVMVNSY